MDGEPGTADETRYSIGEIDGWFRDATVEKKAIAERLGVSPTGLYAALKDRNVRPATLSFLINDETGLPLSPITQGEIEAACRAALARGRGTRIAP